jgi:hypothetical protein
MGNYARPGNRFWEYPPLHTPWNIIAAGIPQVPVLHKNIFHYLFSVLLSWRSSLKGHSGFTARWTLMM